MNTITKPISLTAEEKELLDMLYRQSKFCDGMQINFLSAKLGLPSVSAESAAQNLHAQGLVHFQKYGVLRLTEYGKNYLQGGTGSAALHTGDAYEKSYPYPGLL